MSAIKPVQRISDRHMGGLIATLLEQYTGPYDTRREYIRAVLATFAFAVAERSANPASLEEIPGDVGLYSEMDYALGPWAKKAARELDKLLDSLL